MGLIVLRCVFLCIAIGLGAALLQQLPRETTSPWLVWGTLGGTIALAVGVMVVDVLTPRKRLEIISSVYFGTVVGFLLAYAVRLALTPLFTRLDLWQSDAINVMVGATLCYACISLLMQTKDDFRFIIPYVEFAKEIKGRKPYVIDSSVIIDGRIADVVETGVIDTQLIVPRFVLGEIQGIADSSDRLRRSRGRRGLDVLNRLRTGKLVELQIFERDLPELVGHPVDLQLVLLAKHLGGKVVTNDFNLNKVAKLHGVGVINLNELAGALKPVFLPGEHLDVRIVKPGEEAGQGVGYLDDGTMVVVEAGREHVNQTVKVAVTSVLQTSAGRMIFGRCENGRG